MIIRRVCEELGYTVSQRDIENMINVMSPTQLASTARSDYKPSGVRPPTADGTYIWAYVLAFP